MVNSPQLSPCLVFFKLINLINFFLSVLGLHCCAWAFSSCSEWGLLFTVVHGPLIAVASPAVEHGLQNASSVAVVHRSSLSTAYGILPDQGSNLRPLHWQADSQPMHHQGSPSRLFQGAQASGL